MSAYRVLADIRYMDGALAGLTIREGYSLTAPDLHHATRTAAWLDRVRVAGDFVRACGTGNRYKIASAARYVVLP